LKTIVKFLQDQKYFKKSNELQHSFVINTHSPYSYLVTIVNKYNSLIHWFFFYYIVLYMLNRIGGIMVNVLASSVVDRGFEPRVVYLVLVFSLMVGCSQMDILRQSGIWG
jgi:hypothetical protein